MTDAVEIVVRQPGQPDRVVRVPPGVTQIGRGEESDVILADVGVSRRHARIIISEAGVEVEDLGSGNGTWSRGARLQRQRITDGDEIAIDPFTLLFRLRASGRRDAPSQTPARLDVYGANSARTSYPLNGRGLTLGRNETRDVVLADPACSREHCAIIPRDGAWMLRDNNSANGVFVNGTRVREALLADGDRVRVGNTEMRFLLAETTSEESGPPSNVDNDPWAKTDVINERPTARAMRSGSPVSTNYGPIVGAGLGIVLLVAVLLVAGLVMAGAGVILYQHNTERHEVAQAPPTWALTLPPGLPKDDVRVLQDRGITALRNRDYRQALEQFYRVLQGEPGKPSAERLAYAAGEYLVLDVIGQELSKRTAEEQQRVNRRAQLVAEVDRNGQYGKAYEELKKNYRDDPIVRAHYEWSLGPLGLKAQALVLQASDLMNQRKYSEAAHLYEQVMAMQIDVSWRSTAEAGLESCRRELARAVAADWRAGIAAEYAGNIGEAKSRYQSVLANDPENPSARLRLARFK
jgi:pSer/pThr/pTyr-binding forkhead associated (FHA) protein